MSKDVITKRLVRISKVIPYEKLLERKADDTANIATYYRLNRLAYRFISSRDGFVHMGISSDGNLKKEDFLEQAKIISKYIHSMKASSVLELAAGKAATTKFLANNHKDVAFTGLDLPNGQLDINSSQFPNLKLIEGNYNSLARFENNTFDIVYIIEALCHAAKKEVVVKEVERVLRPGGVFIIFDGYASKSRTLMTQDEALASDLIYTSMMVTKGDHTYDTLRNSLDSFGFSIVEEEDLSVNVLPTMYRFEKLALIYFKLPYFAKLLNKILPLEVTGNAVAAYLMPLSVNQGLHQYWLTVAAKK